MDPTPPDGGWGWMIVVAGFVAQFVTMGQIKSYGVLMLELEKIFHAGATLTSWIGGLAQGLAFGLAPISCVLVNKFGHRPVVIISGFLAGTGMGLGYFANSLAVLFITYGIIFGTAVGLMHNPSVTILPVYFQKHLSLSCGIVIAGGGLGTLCFPLLLELLLHEYNYKFTLLICGGLAFNVIVSGLLMRPLTNARKGTHQQQRKKTPGHADGHFNYAAHVDDDAASEYSESTTVTYIKPDEVSVNSRLPRSVSENIMSDVTGTGETDTVCESKSEVSVTFKSESSDTTNIKQENAEKRDNTTRLFQWYLLFDPYYALFVAVRIMFSFSSIGIYILLPTKVQELDDNHVTEASFVSLMSLTEVTSRLLWALMWDRKPFRPPVVRQFGMATILFLGGVNMLLIGIVESVRILGVLVALMGVLVAGSQAPTILILGDLLGAKSIGDGLGIMMLGQAVILMISPLITGSLLDNLGSVTSSYVIMGVAWFIASCLCFSLRLLHCCNVNHLQQIEAPSEFDQDVSLKLSHMYTEMDVLDSSYAMPELVGYKLKNNN